VVIARPRLFPVVAVVVAAVGVLEFAGRLLKPVPPPPSTKKKASRSKR
jgi:hypothetical protein